MEAISQALMQLSLPMIGLSCRVSLIGKNQKRTSRKKIRDLSQSCAVKAIQGRFQTPHSKVVWQTAITFVLLGVLTLAFPTEEGPTLQAAISCAANIYFIYQRVKSGWRAFFYGYVLFLLLDFSFKD
jgi:hypothetical protein